MIRRQFFIINIITYELKGILKAGQFLFFQKSQSQIFYIIKNDFDSHRSERHEGKYLARRKFDSQVGRIVMFAVAIRRHHGKYLQRCSASFAKLCNFSSHLTSLEHSHANDNFLGSHNQKDKN